MGSSAGRGRPRQRRKTHRPRPAGERVTREPRPELNHGDHFLGAIFGASSANSFFAFSNPGGATTSPPTFAAPFSSIFRGSILPPPLMFPVGGPIGPVW